MLWDSNPKKSQCLHFLSNHYQSTVQSYDTMPDVHRHEQAKLALTVQPWPGSDEMPPACCMVSPLLDPYTLPPYS